MATDCPKAVQFCAARFARLAADGTTPAGATNGYILTDTLIEATYTRSFRDGDDFEVINGCGGLALAYKAPRIPKGGQLKLSFLNADPELLELLTDGTLITVSGSSDGFADPLLGSAPGPGVSVELYRKAFVGNAPSAAKPWLWTAFPKAVLSQDDETFNNGPTTLSVSGELYENPSWGNGPWNDWPIGAVSNRVSQFTRSTTIPTGACGYSTVPAQI